MLRAVKKPDLLIIADSERDTNLLYATRFFAPDQFVYFRRRGRIFMITSELELGRARRTATVDRVLSQPALQKQFPRARKFPDLIAAVLKSHGLRRARVPSNFPLFLAERLRRAGIRIFTDEHPFFPKRQVKTPEEIRHISTALRTTEAGLAAAIEELRRARIGRDGFLYRGRTKLTAEMLRTTIHLAFTRLGGIGMHTIVANANQACDCHETGHGPLRAHRATVLDLFPRDGTTGYWGDMTRTVVRGRASDQLRKMYAAVQHAQQIAFARIRDGAEGRDIHQAIIDYFDHAGFRTGRNAKHVYGFFHGTGHSVGLDIHESPGIGSREATLRKGNVLTVEPGLYYPGIGGVRLEDVVLVTAKGNRCLSRFPKRLEI